MLLTAALMSFIAGAVITWLLTQRGSAQLAAKLDAANANVSAQQQACAIAQTRLEAAEHSVADLRQQLGQLQQQFEAERQRSVALSLQLEKATTSMAEQQKAHEDQLAVIQDAEIRLKESFKAIASDALQGNSEKFLQVAEAKFTEKHAVSEAELRARKQEVENLVKPLAQSLERFQSEVQQIETKREGAYGEIKSQIDTLRATGERLQSEASRLATALRSTEERGNWGQLQLRNVVQMAGMVRYCDFEEQVSVTDSRGEETRSQRPDMTVRLPNGGTIVVDAKVPLSAYLEATALEEDKEREKKFKEYAKQVRGHVAALGKKSYWSQFPKSPQIVIAFIPGEAFTSAAMQHDPSLMHDSIENNVLIATPVSLIGLLKAVAYGWRQEEVAENAKHIADLGGELYGRLVTLLEHICDVGKGLASSLTSYNKLIGSLEGRVLVSARKFKELNVASTANLPEPKPLDLFARELSSPEAALIPRIAAAAAGSDSSD